MWMRTLRMYDLKMMLLRLKLDRDRDWRELRKKLPLLLRQYLLHLCKIQRVRKVLIQRREAQSKRALRWLNHNRYQPRPVAMYLISLQRRIPLPRR